MTDEPRVLGGRYEVGELIGRGGMAEVHAGHDLRLGRKVAIKILRTDLARDSSFLARFRREAQSAAGLNHPAIVAVYDSGEEMTSESGGAPVQVPYIIMEHIDGRTLREILNDEKVFDPDEAARVTAAVLGALEYSHERGIVHRDIKPANVMVTKGGAVKVMDFGIARALADTAATMTQTQAVLGTARYLSPEQAQGLDVDPRSDLYSAGCLFYELLTGRTPFVGDPVSLVYQHLGEPPKPPSQHQHDLNAAMDAIALHSLEKKPEGRYQTAADFRADLHAARAGQPISQPAKDSLQRAIGAGAAAAGLAGATERIATATPAAAGPPPEQVAWGRDPEPPGVEDDFEDTDEMPVREERHRGGWIVVGILGVLALVAVLWIVIATMSGNDNDEDDTPTTPPPTQEPVTVTVESVVGMQEDEAVEALEAQQLVVDIQAAEDSDAPEGEVTEQDPEAGATANEGDTVTILVSGGPEAVELPDLRDQTEQEARDALEELGFEVAPDADTADDLSTLSNDEAVVDPFQVEPGNVVTTDPRPGENAVPGTDEITIVLAGTTVPVPALTDLNREDATTLLSNMWIREDLGNLRFEEEDSDTVPEGEVTRTAPGPNNAFDRDGGDPLTVYISAGEPEPDTVTIPDLTGETAESARGRLGSLNLTVAEEVVEEDDLDVDPGRVTRTSPASGEEVNEDTEVTIYVARSTVQMPNLIGLSSNEAAEELGRNDLGFTFTFEDSDQEPDEVLSQLDPDGEEISPNSEVDRDTQITLVISRSPGEPNPEVPDDS